MWYVQAVVWFLVWKILYSMAKWAYILCNPSAVWHERTQWRGAAGAHLPGDADVLLGIPSPHVLVLLFLLHSIWRFHKNDYGQHHHRLVAYISCFAELTSLACKQDIMEGNREMHHCTLLYSSNNERKDWQASAMNVTNNANKQESEQIKIKR